MSGCAFVLQKSMTRNSCEKGYHLTAQNRSTLSITELPILEVLNIFYEIVFQSKSAKDDICLRGSDRKLFGRQRKNDLCPSGPMDEVA